MLLENYKWRRDKMRCDSWGQSYEKLNALYKDHYCSVYGL